MVTQSKSDDTFAGLPFGFNAQRLYNDVRHSMKSEETEARATGQKSVKYTSLCNSTSTFSIPRRYVLGLSYFACIPHVAHFCETHLLIFQTKIANFEDMRTAYLQLLAVLVRLDTRPFVQFSPT